jgi:glycosyltransferase involved in cell wall biosynthesis
VLQQSFEDFELLILDNSSHDDKEEIRQMSERDSRIRFIERGRVGITEARRLGAMLSRGKLFALLDSDDYWSRERLERHVQAWTENSIGLSWDRWAEVHGSAQNTYPQPFPEGKIGSSRVAVMLYRSNFIHASAGIVSTNFAREQGFPLLDILSSDWVLFLRAAEYYPAYFIEETLSFKDTSSEERVTVTEDPRRLKKQDLAIQRWALMERPRIYGIEYLKGWLNRIRKRINSLSA